MTLDEKTMTPDEGKKLLDQIELECTEQDDHDPAPCPKCIRIRQRIWLAVESFLESRKT